MPQKQYSVKHKKITRGVGLEERRVRWEYVGVSVSYTSFFELVELTLAGHIFSPVLLNPRANTVKQSHKKISNVHGFTLQCQLKIGSYL